MSSEGAYLSGVPLRAVSALLRAPLVGAPLRRVLAAKVLAPVLARIEATSPTPPPMIAPPPWNDEDAS